MQSITSTGSGHDTPKGGRTTKAPRVLTGDDDELLTTPEAALLLGVGESTLERDRLLPEPRFPFVRLAPRICRYRRGTLRVVVAARSHGNADQAAA